MRGAAPHDDDSESRSYDDSRSYDEDENMGSGSFHSGDDEGGDPSYESDECSQERRRSQSEGRGVSRTAMVSDDEGDYDDVDDGLDGQQEHSHSSQRSGAASGSDSRSRSYDDEDNDEFDDAGEQNDHNLEGSYNSQLEENSQYSQGSYVSQEDDNSRSGNGDEDSYRSGSDGANGSDHDQSYSGGEEQDERSYDSGNSRSVSNGDDDNNDHDEEHDQYDDDGQQFDDVDDVDSAAPSEGEDYSRDGENQNERSYTSEHSRSVSNGDYDEDQDRYDDGQQFNDVDDGEDLSRDGESQDERSNASEHSRSVSNDDYDEDRVQYDDDGQQFNDVNDVDSAAQSEGEDFSHDGENQERSHASEHSRSVSDGDYDEDRVQYDDDDDDGRQFDDVDDGDSASQSEGEDISRDGESEDERSYASEHSRSVSNDDYDENPDQYDDDGQQFNDVDDGDSAARSESGDVSRSDSRSNDDDGSYSQEKDEDSSMSMSELAEEGESSPEREIREVVKNKSVSRVDEDSMWLSQLQKSDHKKTSQSPKQASERKSPSHTSHNAVDDGGRHQSKNEKSIWLTELQQPSEPSISQQGDNSQSQSDQDNAHGSEYDGEPNSFASKDSNESNSRHLYDSNESSESCARSLGDNHTGEHLRELIPTDDEFDENELHDSYSSRQDRGSDPEHLQDSQMSIEDDPSISNPDDSDKDGSDFLTDDHESANSRLNEDDSQSEQLEDSYTSRDKPLSTNSDSREFDGSYGSRDEDRSHSLRSEDHSYSQELDENYSSRDEERSYTNSISDDHGHDAQSQSDSRNVDSLTNSPRQNENSRRNDTDNRSLYQSEKIRVESADARRHLPKPATIKHDETSVVYCAGETRHERSIHSEIEGSSRINSLLVDGDDPEDSTFTEISRYGESSKVRDVNKCDKVSLVSDSVDVKGSSDADDNHEPSLIPVSSMASSFAEFESSVSDFESFAGEINEVSQLGTLEGNSSLSKAPQQGEVSDEDVSILSVLPVNAYAGKAMSNPLDEPSVASELSAEFTGDDHESKMVEKIFCGLNDDVELDDRAGNSSKAVQREVPETLSSKSKKSSLSVSISETGSNQEVPHSRSKPKTSMNDEYGFTSTLNDASSNGIEMKSYSGHESVSSGSGSGSFADETSFSGARQGGIEKSQNSTSETASPDILKDMDTETNKIVRKSVGDGNSVGSRKSRHSQLSDQLTANSAEKTMRLSKPETYGGYSREQMARLIAKSRSIQSALQKNDENATSSPKRRKRQGLRDRGKGEALLELVTTVYDTMVVIRKDQEVSAKEADAMLTSRRLLYAFEALVGVLLQLSDELELLLTFSNGQVSPAIQALESLLAFSKAINDTILELNPILQHYLTAEMDEELDDFLYGMNLLVDLLCQLSNRVGEKQQWNARANTAFTTLLELLVRDTLEVSCIFEDVDTPEYELTYRIQDAWEATGHMEEVKTLLVTTDLFMFRQICYEVILSTDQWCPDNAVLMDICGIDEESANDQVKLDDEDVLSPSPEAALQILEKIHGEPLDRTSILASVLRRILPVQAITDPAISENFARIRNTVRNPLGMPPSSLVTITSTPESQDNPDSLGVAGVGKTTLAAMVADHDDVRRFFNDGVAWIYVGESELSYNRYVQCLQDVLSQLEVDEEEEPLFPELLHIPGESYAMRRRREEGFMIYLRETMVEFLRYRNVLLVLDDVCFEPDLDWFDFAQAPLEADEQNDDEGSCAILITSRRRNLLPPADTVEVDMLDEDEGVQLLMRESGELARALIADAPETKSVVLECACHPLTIKSVGRWLNLKHATADEGTSIDELRVDVVNSMNRIVKSGMEDDSDMMYEILSMSLSPAIDGKATSIIKLCFAAFVRVFCERKHISDFALADSTPIVPMATTELLFESLLSLERESLLREGSLFNERTQEAAKLIPEALSALGIFKVIITFAESENEDSEQEEDEKYLQIMHRIQQEYGDYLYEEDETLTELTKDGETRWNKAFAIAFMEMQIPWDTQAPDAGLDYALEMLPSHLLRGKMITEADDLLRNEKFVRGRLFALGRENGCRRHIKDCEALFDLLLDKKIPGRKKFDPKVAMRSAYETLGDLLKMDEDEYIEEEGSPEAVEVGRCHFEIGFSLAERRCWEGAISHWESSQEFLVSSLGMVELVAGILYNIGVVNVELNEFEQALGSLKQCLRIRGAIHGEEHILYAQTIQKIGDVFLAMSDYHEALESYNWALDVMHTEPSHHRIDIGDILEQMGKIHYSKGEIEESLQSFQDALRSKQVDLGEDHPELASIFHQIGNCLSNQGRADEAIAHLEEAIRLKLLDPDGGYERDSDVLTIEGILNNLNNMQKEGLECYEKALHILVTKVPHKKEKVASLLNLIGCVYLMSGEQKKAMKLFEESLHARRKVLGFVHLDVASTLFNMAFLHQSRNRLDKALKCLEEALKIRQLRLPDSEKVAITHEKIGTLARGIGKTKKAENAFAEALRIRKIIHGNNHEAVATVLHELGDLMDDLGEYEEAMKHYVEALEIRENRLGPDDLAVAETYYSMGFTLQNNIALDRALQCLEESLSIRKFQLGDDAKEVGDTLNMMGFLQAKRGELDDALSLLWDSLRIRKLLADHVKVSETLNNIGNVHREKQEYNLAIECYEECLRIRRAELGDDHEKVADALIAKGNVQSDLEYNEEAMDSYKEALAIRNMIFGEQDESVATVLQCMGTLEFRANELDRAFQLLDEFVRIRQENGTEPDGDYVNVLFVIGNIHKMQSNEEEAKKCWTEAYGVFKQLGLAETNPQIAEVMGSLVKDEEVAGTPKQKGKDKNSAKNVLSRITAKVKKAARTANEAGNAVKKVTGIKGQDRGSQLL